MAGNTMRDVTADTLLTFALSSQALADVHLHLARIDSTFPRWRAFVCTWVHPLYCHEIEPVHLTTNVMLRTARELKYYFDQHVKDLDAYERDNLDREPCYE